jgi:hypothetical protein
VRYPGGWWGIAVLCLGALLAGRASTVWGQEGGLAAELMDVDFSQKGVVQMDVEVRNLSAKGEAITKVAIQSHPWLHVSDPAGSPLPGWQVERASHLDAVFKADERKGLQARADAVFRVRLIRPAQEALENLFQGGEEGKTLLRVTATFAGGSTAVADVPVPFLPALE